MAFKKIDKDFILSDSSENVYGMRLLTKGYKMEEFLKNPIGYYGHFKNDGVLLKWEDLRLDGDNIIGKPVVNMEHPRAERTVKEVEEGFLNSASVGKLCILDYELEDNPKGGEPIIVVTNWYNKECSLVDNPGNRHAMKVELYDKDDKEINLSDLIEVVRTRNDTQQKRGDNMKKVTLEITAALMGLLSLKDDGATAEAVVKGIQDLSDENKRLDSERTAAIEALDNERKAASAAKVAEIIAKGLSDKKITKATGDKLAARFANMPTDLADLLDTMPAYVSVVDQLKTDEATAGTTDVNLADKSWDELDKGGFMPKIKAEHPELYKAKFKAKFGKEPTV